MFELGNELMERINKIVARIDEKCVENELENGAESGLYI